MLQHQSQTGVLVYYYHNDHLGTPQELTNSKGEVVWLNYQFAWGGSFEQKCLVNELDKLDVSADELQPFRFQGQMFDVETGLHYNRFRYYDSDVGMFIQRDPIGLMGGNNVFAYAPNPVGWVDPLGLNTEVYFMNPVQDGFSHSMFGHVAYRINDTVFTLNPTTNLASPLNYIQNQKNIRDMVGLKLKLSPSQEANLLKQSNELKKTADYTNGVYMCTNPIQDVLQKSGFNIYEDKAIVTMGSTTLVKQPSLSPQALFNRMILRNDLVEKINIYDNPKYGFRGNSVLSPDFIQQAKEYKGSIPKK